MRAGLVDEFVVYLAPAVIGDPARGMFESAEPLTSLVARVNLDWTAVDRIGADLRIVARVRRSTAPTVVRG